MNYDEIPIRDAVAASAMKNFHLLNKSYRPSKEMLQMVKDAAHEDMKAQSYQTELLEDISDNTELLEQHTAIIKEQSILIHYQANKIKNQTILIEEHTSKIESLNKELSALHAHLQKVSEDNVIALKKKHRWALFCAIASGVLSWFLSLLSSINLPAILKILG